MDAMPKTSICPDCAGVGSDTHMRSMNPPYQKLVARQCTVVTARDEFLFRPCPLRPLHNAKSESTRRAYRSDWQDFERWCAPRGLAVMTADIGTVAAYDGISPPVT